MIDLQSKVTQIKTNSINFHLYPGVVATYGLEFLDKEGKSILIVGPLDGNTTKVFNVEENEQFISIKALTVREPTDTYHGTLYNFKFKIVKLI